MQQSAAGKVKIMLKEYREELALQQKRLEEMRASL